MKQGGITYISDLEDEWGNNNQIGLGEHAIRTGSPSIFDRRGQVYFFDTFNEYPLKWVVHPLPIGGSNFAITLSDEYVFKNDGSVRIIAPDTIDSSIYITNGFGFVHSRYIGIESTVLFEDIVRGSYYMCMEVLTGTRYLVASVKLDESTLSLMVDDLNFHFWDRTNYTPFSTSHKLTNKIHYSVKLVIDTVNEKYLRFMIGGTEIDISSYPIYASNTVYAPYVNCNIGIISQSAISNNRMFVDNVIFTIQESP